MKMLRQNSKVIALSACIVFTLVACGDQVVVRETEAQCGNGNLEAGEACDDGNTDNADACTNSC